MFKLFKMAYIETLPWAPLCVDTPLFIGYNPLHLWQ